MNALGRFAAAICGMLGVTPAHLDEIRNAHAGRSALRAHEWGVEDGWGEPVNVAQYRLRFGWPAG